MPDYDNHHDSDDGYGRIFDDDAGRRLIARPVMIGATCVIALCLAFLTGYRAAHGHDPAARTAAEPSTAVAPTDPTHDATSPSASNAQPATPRGPLIRNSVDVITGYSHDQQGAIAAAGNYTAALYVQTNRSHTRELTVLDSIATTPADAARMAGDFTSEDVALATLLDVANLQTPGVIAYGHPVGYRAESVTGIAATVDVYVVGGQGLADAPTDSAAAGETFYEVDQVQLAWQRGDWRLSNWSHLVQDNGPQLASVAAEGYLPFPIGQTDTNDPASGS